MPDSSRFLPVIPDPGRESGSASGAAPIFERIAILGLGLMGGSIALAARKAWPAALVIGVDRHDVLEKAMVRHAVDVASSDPTIASAADLVVLAVPEADLTRVIAGLPSWLPSEAIVTDVASTKRAVVEAAAALPPRLTFVGGCPLAGRPESGFDHARADLFTGRPWILTPGPSGTEPAAQALEKVAAFVAGLGAVAVRAPSAGAHDELVDAMDRVIAQLESLAPGLASAETVQRLFAAAAERHGQTGQGS